MIFKSDLVPAQWDTWSYYHNNTFYLYYLIAGRNGFDGFGVATSPDGVHWRDHGWAIRASDHMVEYLGTGAVWKAVDFETSGRFICNYSEWREEPATGRKTQNILFAWSTDLIHWHKFGDERMFRVDERFYERHGRWDCIYPLPRAEGGYYGTWTATPKGAANLNAGIGFGTSDDGLVWEALPAAQVEPPADEAGAFHRFGDRIYAMFGRWDTGMVCYEADNPRGPYRQATTNAVLLGGGMRHTYFARFFPMPQGVLVNHHSMSGKKVDGRPITYAAPLKLAEVDRGVLRWRYWPGNEALKGEPVPLSFDSEPSAVQFVASELDFTTGVIAEGALDAPGPSGLCLEVDGRRFGIRMSAGGRVDMGPMDADGTLSAVEHTADRGWQFGEAVRFRLLARRGMLEFYLDDQFVECYTPGCPDAASIRLGVLPGIRQDELRVWRMSLP